MSSYAILISSQKFSDAEQLYRAQLALFAMFFRKQIQLYLGDAPTRFALVAVTASDLKVRYVGLGTLWDIFNLSLAMVNYDRSSGFNLLSGLLDPYWCRAIKDLLEEPQGEFFINDNQYADIALHMVKYMSAHLEYV